MVSEATERLRTLQAQDAYAEPTEIISKYTITVQPIPNQALSYFWWADIETEGKDEPLRTMYEVKLGQTRDPNLQEA